jgi:ribosomal protein S27AE
MHKNKINRAAVMAAQNTACPSCGYSIPPAEIQRVSTEQMKCPKCGSVFEAGKATARER